MPSRCAATEKKVLRRRRVFKFSHSQGQKCPKRLRVPAAKIPTSTWAGTCHSTKEDLSCGLCGRRSRSHHSRLRGGDFEPRSAGGGPQDLSVRGKLRTDVVGSRPSESSSSWVLLVFDDYQCYFLLVVFGMFQSLSVARCGKVEILQRIAFEIYGFFAFENLRIDMPSDGVHDGVGARHLRWYWR
jgi:hypothetical protein